MTSLVIGQGNAKRLCAWAKHHLQSVSASCCLHAHCHIAWDTSVCLLGCMRIQRASADALSYAAVAESSAYAAPGRANTVTLSRVCRAASLRRRCCPQLLWMQPAGKQLLVHDGLMRRQGVYCALGRTSPHVTWQPPHHMTHEAPSTQCWSGRSQAVAFCACP